MRRVQLKTVDLPDFGLPTIEPVIPPETYARRLRNVPVLWRFPLTHEPETLALVVYGDREHVANLAYLTGYDPRFEEALLLLIWRRQPNGGYHPGRPVLVVGNEGWGYADLAPVDHHRVLYQNFSLLGQPRDRSASLETIFREAGIGANTTVGVVGWKYFSESDSRDYRHWLEIPTYIAEALWSVVGKRENVFNATATFMNPEYGLRAINDVDQLAAFEFAATHSSQAIRNVLFGLQPGISEYDAVRLMRLNGIPLSAHLMLSSGPRASAGLCSPSSRIIERGDPLTMALGLWGGLNARAGFVVSDAGELPDAIQDYTEKLVAPYFRAVVEWYEAVGIGVEGGTLYDIIHRHLGDAFFGVGLNPGHLIHLDEWLHSPIYVGSTIPLKSGMALQVDVIPATGTPYFTTNIEDGIALADEELRADFASQYPEAWDRVQRRRQFMQEVLGIRLKPEVLPFSNIPAYLPPFLLNPRRVMAVEP